jgi:hypothetical protein
MLVSNDDTRDIKITLQCVKFDHGSKRLLVKKRGQKHQPMVDQKNHSNCTRLVKIDLSYKTKGIFLPLSLGVLFGLKTQFEKLGILVVITLFLST